MQPVKPCSTLVVPDDSIFLSSLLNTVLSNTVNKASNTASLMPTALCDACPSSIGLSLIFLGDLSEQFNADGAPETN